MGTPPDDGGAGRQARLLRRALEGTGVGVGRLWMDYFSLGGDAGVVEVDAYLHECLGLPAFQRDLLAHAANGLIRTRSPRAPYSGDVPGGGSGGVGGGPPAGPG